VERNRLLKRQGIKEWLTVRQFEGLAGAKPESINLLRYQFSVVKVP
jgi:hypothetical protein